MNCLFPGHCEVKILRNLALAFMLLHTIVATADGAESMVFTYPEQEGDASIFDDTNPICGPETALVFERIFKSGGGAQKLYCYEPFSGLVMPLAAPEQEQDLSSERFNEPNFFAGYPSWVSSRIDEVLQEGIGPSQTKRTYQLYQFVHTQLPHIRFVELTIPVRRAERNTVIPRLESRILVSGESNGIFENKYADYSPQNGFVAYVCGLKGQGDIYVKAFPKDGGTIEDDPGWRVTENNVLDLAPRWSPDGRDLVYTSYSQDENTPHNIDVFLIKDLLTEGGSALNSDRKTIRLTTSERDEIFPTWSPDGELLAFYSVEMASDASRQPEHGNTAGKERSARKIHNLCVVNPDGEIMDIARDIYRQAKRGPVWLPLLEDLKERRLIYVSSTYDEVLVANVDEAMANPETSVPLPIIGLAGYKYKHITDLDCKQFDGEHFRNRIWLAYSAHNRQGRKRIYVEIIDYSKKPWEIEKSILPE